MSRIRLLRTESGGFVVERWPVWAARLLEHLAVLAAPDPIAPEVKDRLYPAVGDDEKRRAEWARNVHPELFALVESARTVVIADLAGAERGTRGALTRLEVPAEHVPAWISALNTARLHLATLHDIDAGAMRAPSHDLTDEKRGPVGLIDFYGWIQGLLVESRLAQIDRAAAGGGAKPAGEAPTGDAPAGDEPKRPRKPRAKKPKADEPGDEAPPSGPPSDPASGPAT